MSSQRFAGTNTAQVLYPAPGQVAGADEPVVDTEAAPTLSVDGEGLTIGDVFVPSSWIERGSVVIRPGVAVIGKPSELRDLDVEDTPPTVSVTFLVGDINVDESAFDQVQLLQRLGFTVPGDLKPAEAAVVEHRTIADPSSPAAQAAAADDSWDVLRDGG